MHMQIMTRRLGPVVGIVALMCFGSLAYVLAADRGPDSSQVAYLPIVRNAPHAAPVASVVVLQNYTHIVQEGFTLLGEVYNNGEAEVSWVGLVVDFYDGAGQIMETSHFNIGGNPNVYMAGVLGPESLRIPVGGKACFALRLPVNPIGWTAYQFRVPSVQNYSSGMMGVDNLAIPEFSALTDRVVGRIRNDQDHTLELIVVSVTGYDGGGRVIACDAAILNQDELPAAEAASFRAPTHANSYAVRAQGSFQRPQFP